MFPPFEVWVKEFVSKKHLLVLRYHIRPDRKGHFILYNTRILPIPYREAIRIAEDLEAWALMYEGVYQLWEEKFAY